MKKNKQLSKYDRAKKRVAKIKGFYNHAAIYVVVNILLFVLRGKFTFILLSKGAIGNPGFLDWIDWNVFGTTVVWGIALVIHGISVFANPLLGKKWEERQFRKFLEEDEVS